MSAKSVATVGEVVHIKSAAKRSPAKAAAGDMSPRAKRRPTVKLIALRQSEARTVGQLIAASAAAFLPIASYVIAHFEAKSQPMLWILVAAALMFSAPTLADWAEKWCKSPVKAWGFTILLEGVMVFGMTTSLGIAGLMILVAINCNSAYRLAGESAKEASKKRAR